MHNSALDKSLFTDLSDMNAHFAGVAALLAASSLRYEKFSLKSPALFFATIDVTVFFDSVSFFLFDDDHELKALATFTHVDDNRDLEKSILRYSLGYAISPKWRNMGVGSDFVRQSLSNFQTFLGRTGPDIDGVFTGRDITFLLDVVVRNDNQISRRLANQVRSDAYQWSAVPNKEESSFTMPLVPLSH